MTTDELAATALLTEFPQNQIFHDDVPENGTYPMICYTDLSETPVLHADNELYAYETIIRVTAVLFGNAGINDMKQRIHSCMTNAGFMWQDTNKTRDGKEYYLTMDFSIGRSKKDGENWFV